MLDERRHGSQKKPTVGGPVPTHLGELVRGRHRQK